MSREKFNQKERLKMIRLKMGGISQANLSKQLGIPVHKIKDIESGKIKLSVELALLLEEYFNFSFRWLLIGEGSMYRHEKEKLPNSIDNIADIPREQIKQWIDDFWKNSDEDERAWLKVEMKRKFPEFTGWLKKNGESLSE